jgi:hypothetical protein
MKVGNEGFSFKIFSKYIYIYIYKQIQGKRSKLKDELS